MDNCSIVQFYEKKRFHKRRFIILKLKQAVIQEQGANPIIGVQLSTTGKKVEKRLVASNQVLKTWNTIAKASESEGFSTAKMSRSVKDKTVFNDYYYCVAV
jgi:hypothetical protein